MADPIVDPNATGDTVTPPAPVADPVAPPTTQLTGETLQRELDRVRAEAAKHRTEAAKHRTELKAVREANEARDRAIAKALGLESEAPDPEKLMSELSARDAKIRDLTVTSALNDVAAELGAKPKLLKALLREDGALSGLDPSAPEFAAALRAVASETVKANPEIRVTQAGSPVSGTPIPGGSGGVRKFSEDQIARMSPEDFAKNRDAIFAQMAAE